MVRSNNASQTGRRGRWPRQGASVYLSSLQDDGDNDRTRAGL